MCSASVAARQLLGFVPSFRQPMEKNRSKTSHFIINVITLSSSLSFWRFVRRHTRVHVTPDCTLISHSIENRALESGAYLQIPFLRMRCILNKHVQRGDIVLAKLTSRFQEAGQDAIGVMLERQLLKIPNWNDSNAAQ